MSAVIVRRLTDLLLLLHGVSEWVGYVRKAKKRNKVTNGGDGGVQYEARGLMALGSHRTRRAPTHRPHSSSRRNGSRRANDEVDK